MTKSELIMMRMFQLLQNFRMIRMTSYFRQVIQTNNLSFKQRKRAPRT